MRGPWRPAGALRGLPTRPPAGSASPPRPQFVGVCLGRGGDEEDSGIPDEAMMIQEFAEAGAHWYWSAPQRAAACRSAARRVPGWGQAGVRDRSE